MATFTPPTLADRPSYNADSTEIQKALFRFYHNPLNSRYVAVYQLSDGTFVQSDETPGFTNTTLPYPWNPNNPAGPYVTSYYWDLSVVPPVLHFDQTSLAVYIVRRFNGVTVVDSATAALLTTAGYGAYLT